LEEGRGGWHFQVYCHASSLVFCHSLAYSLCWGSTQQHSALVSHVSAGHACLTLRTAPSTPRLQLLPCSTCRIEVRRADGCTHRHIYVYIYVKQKYEGVQYDGEGGGGAITRVVLCVCVCVYMCVCVCVRERERERETM
jgi:hypothetical protein